MRLGALVERLVVDERRGTEGAGFAAAERPFAAVAIGGADIAVEVETPLMAGGVAPRPMDREGAPEGEIAGLQFKVDDPGGVEAGVAEALRRHRAVHHPAGDRQLEFAQAVGARIDAYGAAPGAVAVDRDAGLDVGVGKVPVRLARPAEADVLMEGELGR